MGRPGGRKGERGKAGCGWVYDVIALARSRPRLDPAQQRPAHLFLPLLSIPSLTIENHLTRLTLVPVEKKEKKTITLRVYLPGVCAQTCPNQA